MFEFTEEELEEVLTDAYTEGWTQRSIDPGTGEYLKPAITWSDEDCANYVCTVVTRIEEDD